MGKSQKNPHRLAFSIYAILEERYAETKIMENSNEFIYPIENVVRNNNARFQVKQSVLREDFPMHCHDYIEMEIVLSGKGTTTINHERYELRRGFAYLLISKQDYHDFHVEEPTETINLSLDYQCLVPTLSNALFCFSQNLVLQFDEEELFYIQALLFLLKNEYEHQKTYSDFMTQNLISTIFVLFIRKLDLNIPKAANTDKNFLPALNYIHYNFKDNPSLEDVAAYAHFNKAYFCTLFKRYTGKTYSQYLLNLKLEHAKRLLRSNQWNILEISERSGFNSLSNFNRCFKKIVGCSPSDYRKHHLQK